MNSSKCYFKEENVVRLRLIRLLDLRTKYNINDSYKRSVDVITASIGLLVFIPVMLIITAVVKLTSPGPLFFRQERITQKERVFYILKFRTMSENAEAKTGPVWSDQNDCRVTPIGKILRSTHLDELPQLWNVLMGDMSIVGPRPERPVFVKQFKEQGVCRYSDRHLAKAGITGYAQLRNPHPTLEDIQKKTQDDLWYIENWSLLLDLKIIAGTFVYFMSSIWEVALHSLGRILSRVSPVKSLTVKAIRTYIL